jgi:hypothetical protein
MTYFDLGVRALASCGIGLTLLFTRAAEAQTTTQTPTAEQPTPPSRLPRFTDSPVQLEAVLGLGTKVGELGLAGDINVANRLTVGAGLGAGLWGPIWEVHARARPLVFSEARVLTAFTIETAFSRGKYASIPLPISGCGQSPNDVTDGCFDASTIPRETSFIQLEVGWEMRLHGRWVLRVSTGIAEAIAMTAPQCVDRGEPTSCGPGAPSDTVFALTTAFGYAF